MNNIYERTVKHFGIDNQMRQTQEECAELIVAINKFMRFGDKDISVIYNVAEEIGDVEIMLTQIKSIFPSETLEAIKAYKLKKLERLLNNGHPRI